MANTTVALYNPDSVSADTYTDTQDMLAYDQFTVYYNVSNGSSTAGHLIDLTIQTCSEDSTDNNDWVNLLRDEGTAFPQITGTGGANPWPKAYMGLYSTYARYIRGFIDVTNGTWTVEIQIVGRD